MSDTTRPTFRETIRSTRNRRVRAAADLSRRRVREERRLYLAEGTRLVTELLSAGDVEEMFAVAGEADDVVGLAEQRGVPVTGVTRPVIERLASSVTPQGVVAVARQRRRELADVLGTGFVVVLLGVADPGNAGTAIRTATAAGAQGLILTAGSVDPWNPKAVRASAGTVARLALVVGVDPADVLAACADAGQRTVALDPSAGASIDAPRVLTPPVALLFGSEAHGLPPEILASCDTVASVPLHGPAESLNLAAAVAVVAYAAAREQGGAA